MKEGLLEQIRESGHWRVNIRPRDPGPKRPLGELVDLVRRSTVSIRGWDYPHYSHRNDDDGGSENHVEFFENWTDWNGFKEFWRIYKTRQFLSYQMLHEDTDYWNEGYEVGTALNSIAASYSVFEFVEFAFRLSQTDTFPAGVDLHVRLGNSQGRRLYAGRGRIPFFGDKQTHGEQIEVSGTLRPSASQSDARDLAIAMCVEIFDAFNWSVSPEQLQQDQDKFYQGSFRG